MTSTSTSFPAQYHRSSRAEIRARDIEVQNLVDELRNAQRQNWTILADCIERCHSASFCRAAWRSSPEASSGIIGRCRCKTLACPACGAGMWRKAVRMTFDRFHDVAGEDISLAIIAGTCAASMEAVRVEVRRTRRSLRDLRDAQAEKRTSWREVRIAGLVDLLPVRDHGALLVKPVARLLVHHQSVPRGVVARVMRDWFSGSGRDVDVAAVRGDTFMSSPPGTGLPMPWRAAVVATLFEWGRGLEPLRVAVGAQGCPLTLIGSAGEGGSPKRVWFEPMPVAFG